MPLTGRGLIAGALCALLLLLTPVALSAETRPAGGGATVTLSIAEVRAGLRKALADQQDAIAAPLAEALLRHDPADFQALSAMAQIGLRQGRPDIAHSAATRARAAARSETQRFEAALLLSQTSAAQGGPAGALIGSAWARRAHDLAPNDAWRRLARGEVQRLRAASPLQLQLSFAIAPSSNVNNGSQQSVIEFWGLPFQLSPQARALKGWIGQLGLSGHYVLGQSDRSATLLRFAAQHREVRLSSRARADLEQWRLDQLAIGTVVVPQTNYNFSALELGLQHRWRAGPVLLDLGATVGHNWYGGRDMSDYLRLSFGAERAVSDRLGLHGGLQLERQWRKDGAQRNADIAGVSFGSRHLLGNGDRLHLMASLRRTRSDSAEVAHDATQARLVWEKAAPVAGLRLSAGVGAEARRYGPIALAPGGRRDLRLDANVSVVFENAARMGFAPVLDLTVSRTRSNVALYEGRNAGVMFGLRSTF